MKRHAEAGAEILSEIPALAPYAPIVATHHEWFDGRGYPHGLRGDDISLESRVVSVADSFHAMTTDRPYRRALSYGEAIAALVDGRGRQWDKEVADVMIALAAEDRNSSADANLSALAGSLFGPRAAATRRRPGDLTTPRAAVSVAAALPRRIVPRARDPVRARRLVQPPRVTAARQPFIAGITPVAPHPCGQR